MKTYDVIGIGNPLMDITVNVDDTFLEELGLKKGSMTLIDEIKHSEIIQKLCEKQTLESTGGSASNTIKGVSVLGGTSAFMGMIGNDKYGKEYERLLEKANVKSVLAKCSKNSGLSIICVTPDNERTMITYLGAALEFSESNINEDILKNAKILHVEGFFIELEKNRNAAIKAMKIIKEHNGLVSIDLSDAGLIQRTHNILKDLLKNYVDIVFVNEHEAKAFTGVEELDAAHALSEYCDVSVVKLGSKGSIIKHVDTKQNKTSIHNVAVHKVEVVNTNGAGDSYAAGILYSIANDIPFDKAGKIASYISSKVVSIPEATLNCSLKDEVKKIIEE